MSESDRLAGEWLQYALEDLAIAEAQLADDAAPPRYACFHSQQATEKAVKALLVRAQIEFERTHDLEKLARQVEPALEASMRELADLSRWATQTRYPSDPPATNAEDAVRAIHVARAVVAEVSRRFGGEG